MDNYSAHNSIDLHVNGPIKRIGRELRAGVADLLGIKRISKKVLTAFEGGK
jgi:hypothetical protein